MAEQEIVLNDTVGAEAPAGETYGGYCVKCKDKREFVGTVELTANNRQMAKGTCPVCGTKMARILGKKKES